MAKTLITSEDKKILDSMFWNSHLNFIAASGVKLLANGVTITMGKALDSIYADDEEARIDAYVRTQNFFNTHAVPFAFIMGLIYAMEKEKKAGNLDGQTIESVKAALMGPTAGMFDSIFFNTLRVIAAGIGMGFAQQGSILGAVFFLLIYGVPQSICKYFFVKWGYVYGTSFIDSIFNSGMMASFTKSATILGLMMVGAMTASMVNVPLNWVIKTGDTEVVVLEILEQIFPGLLSIVLLFSLVGLIKKGVRPMYLIFIVMGVALLGAILGLF